MNAIMLIYIPILLLLFLPSRATATITLHGTMGENMVIQQGKPFPLHGNAAPGEDLLIEFLGQKIKVRAHEKTGDWLCQLPPYQPGGPYELQITGALGRQIHLKNLLIGEVWICAGQSNMDFPLGGVLIFRDEVERAKDSRIRLFHVPKDLDVRPRSEIGGYWTECTPGTARRFSAVGWFFAKALKEHRKVPIGIIHSAWGGSPIEAWLPPPIAGEGRVLTEETMESAVSAYTHALNIWQPHQVRWMHFIRNALDESRPLNVPPGIINVFKFHEGFPGGMWNAMVAPWTRYPIQGVIWYQGESNLGHADQYRKLFPNLISAWRREWDDEFPFLYAQISSYGMPGTEYSQKSEWAELREAQESALALPATGMAVTIDLGNNEGDFLHPREKRLVGMRLADLARKTVNSENPGVEGPKFRSLKFNGSSAIVEFSVKHGSLRSRQAEVRGFTLASKDGRNYIAKGELRGDNTVVVSCDEVPEPVAVRYGWTDYHSGNLVDEHGLPALPFRKDSSRSAQ
jgi:sialate O-acetylesterase